MSTRILKMHSTLTSLLNVTDAWFSNIDKRKINISVFLDLKKAFDTVDHGSPLKAYKVRRCRDTSSVVHIVLDE